MAFFFFVVVFFRFRGNFFPNFSAFFILLTSFSLFVPFWEAQNFLAVPLGRLKYKMADTLPWVDEQAAKDAIAAVRKDSDPTDWYEKRKQIEVLRFRASLAQDLLECCGIRVQRTLFSAWRRWTCCRCAEWLEI